MDSLDSTTEVQGASSSTQADVQPLRLEQILLIYPVIHSLATALSAGDLISLGRTSRTFRSITHGFNDSPPIQSSSSLLPIWSRKSSSMPLAPELGQHQTNQWASLKSICPFTCVSPSHKDPKSSSSSSDWSRKSKHPIQPCNFCSRPICRTCIVRSFFADPTSSRNTFKHRTRYLCVTCWDTGNLRKDFRYPVTPGTSRELIWHGQRYTLRGGRCKCSASEDNWLCGNCRVAQNHGGAGNLSMKEISDTSLAGIDSRKKVEQGEHIETTTSSAEVHLETSDSDGDVPTSIPCYGLECYKTISPLDPTRDKRRICLWCARPLPRPFGGGERLKWEGKQLSVRAAYAASRSADIGEWARNRFRSLTISRKEMRGTPTGTQDSIERQEERFVRHLDAVNYRAFLGEHSVPTPDDVYRSKNGYWRYSTAFLNHQQLRESDLGPPGTITKDDLSRITSECGLAQARTNMRFSHRRSLGGETPIEALTRLGAQFCAANLMTARELSGLEKGQYRLCKDAEWETVLNVLYEELVAFEDAGAGTGAERERTVNFGDLFLDLDGVLINMKPSTSDDHLASISPMDGTQEGAETSSNRARQLSRETQGITMASATGPSLAAPFGLMNGTTGLPASSDGNPPSFESLELAVYSQTTGRQEHVEHDAIETPSECR